MKPERVAIGSDHRGYALKARVESLLSKKGFKILNCGTNSEESCDYPEPAFKVCDAVVAQKADLGILICGSGIGMSIAANKVRGIRAALCRSVKDGEFSRRHNNANVLALGADHTKAALAEKICLKWLETNFEGGRHERRIQLIEDYEKHHNCH